MYGLPAVGSHRSKGGSYELGRAGHAGPHEQHRRSPDLDCEPVATAGTATEQSTMSVMSTSEYHELKQSCDANNKFLYHTDQGHYDSVTNWSDENSIDRKVKDNPVMTKMNEYL